MTDVDCIFCKIAKKDLPAEIISESEDLVAFADVKPQAPVHILVIPKEHISSLNDAAMSKTLLLGQMIMMAKAIATEKNLSEAGYRLVMNIGANGGQTVDHIHLHLLGERQMSWPPG